MDCSTSLLWRGTNLPLITYVIIIILFQSAATNISIPGWRRVAMVCCGPERQNTTNVAACGFTTAANTYAVVANCSRKENGTHAD